MPIACRSLLATLALLACSCNPPPSTATPGSPDGSPTSSPDSSSPPASADSRVLEPDASRPPLRVLFIGNSYTYVNDLPGLLARIAATSGTTPTIATDQVVQGSATLHVHWDNGIAQTRIAGEPWTHVVLQGQSLEAAYPGDDDFETYAAKLGAVVTAAGARPTWFVTWARAAGDAGYSSSVGSFLDPDEMQDRITFGYDDVARAVPGSLLSCVGEAFRASQRDHPEIVLHQADNSHPTVAGTYLAASTFYVALTGSPVPPASEVPPEVSADEAKALRQAALVGSACGSAKLKGIVAWQYCATQCKPLEFGVMGTPLAQILFLSNTGYATAGITDASTLAAPFAWTSGAYPGGSGTASPSGLPFCSSTLAPNSTCALSVTYSAALEGTSTLTLDATSSYYPNAVRAMHGSPTTRALLTVSEDAGFFGATDSSQSGLPAILMTPSGSTTTRGFVVSNRGAAPTTTLAVATPLAAPFAWGPTGSGGSFPGGSGKGQVNGVTYDYCATQTLGVGQQCMVMVSFSVPSTVVPGVQYDAVVNLAYSDATGPVSPDANRNLRGAIAIPTPPK